LYGAYSQYDAAKDAEKLARKETDEQIRRNRAEDEARLAETRARIAASGLTNTGTLKDYTEDMAKEQKLQRKWTRKAGQGRAEDLYSQGTAGAVGSLGKAASYWA
jgi:ribosomal protein L29